jgi:hypothetical protein
MLVFILILITAITLGTIFSKLLPKYNTNATAEEKATKIGLEKEGQTIKDGVDASKAIAIGSTKEYVALQCGIFSKKENASVLKNSLMKFGTPFIIEEDNLIRVLFGIYPKESIDSITKQLQANKIEYIKINFKLIGKDATSTQINEMISADIKILNKLSEKDTKAIQTAEFKKWLLALEGAEEKSASYTTMTELKTYLNAMPSELKKEKTEGGYVYIYKFIKKVVKI